MFNLSGKTFTVKTNINTLGVSGSSVIEDNLLH